MLRLNVLKKSNAPPTTDVFTGDLGVHQQIADLMFTKNISRSTADRGCQIAVTDLGQQIGIIGLKQAGQNHIIFSSAVKANGGNDVR